jgi:hypothetical protein
VKRSRVKLKARDMRALFCHVVKSRRGARGRVSVCRHHWLVSLSVVVACKSSPFGSVERAPGESADARGNFARVDTSIAKRREPAAHRKRAFG